jgi:hypothetical protein
VQDEQRHRAYVQQPLLRRRIRLSTLPDDHQLPAGGRPRLICRQRVDDLFAARISIVEVCAAVADIERDAWPCVPGARRGGSRFRASASCAR